MYRVTHRLAPTYLTDLCEQCSNTRLRSASRGDYILPRSRLRCVDSSFSISAPTEWNNLPAHICSCTSLCRSFYLNSSLTFSSPLSLLSSIMIIQYSLHTLLRFNSFFPFYFSFYLVCLFLSLFDVIMFGAPELWW